MKIIYLRVSKEDPELQDLAPQLSKITDKFSLNKEQIVVIEDRGSAYKIEQISKRKGFNDLLDMLFKDKTIKQIFLNDIEEEKHELYIWDYHRIIRNFEYSLFFGLLCDFFNVEIYSYKQGHIKRSDETPINKFSRYIMYSINAFSSEDYSYNISTNVKKVVNKEQGITVSHKGNKWGPRFIGFNGARIRVSAQTTALLIERIKKLIKHYEYKKVDNYYSKIQDIIEKEYRIIISKTYISRVKNNEVLNDD